MIFTNYMILIIALPVILILFIIGFRVYRSKNQKSIASNQLSIDFLEKLVNALGSENNIKSISSEHQRIKLIIYDLKAVSSQALQALGTPAFLKGKELTILVKHHTNDVIDYINTLKREGN